MLKARPLLSRRGCVPLPDRARARGAAKTRRMSCFVCEPRICRVLFRHEAIVPGRRAGVSVRLARLGAFGMGPSVRSRFVPPAPPPARQRWNPFPRVSRACTPAGAAPAGRCKRRQALMEFHRLDKQPVAAARQPRGNGDTPAPRQPGNAPGPAQKPLHPPRPVLLRLPRPQRVRMAQRVLHPLHRPAALPCPTRPQAQPRAARSPDTPPATAGLRAPAEAQPGLRARPAASAWTGTPARRRRPAARTHSAASTAGDTRAPNNTDRRRTGRNCA